MFADHKKERQDAPDAELDPANGWCLCGAHHSLKTAQEREKRLLKGWGSEISARDRGSEPPGVSRTDFFLGPEKKSASTNWVFPVRDEKSNLPAEAVERRAIWYRRTA